MPYKSGLQENSNLSVICACKNLKILDKVNGVNHDSKRNLPKLKAEADNAHIKLLKFENSIDLRYWIK